MKATRKRYTKEFKLEAVRQLAAGTRLTDVARALGVNATVVRRWQAQVAVDPATAFPGNGRAPAGGGGAPAAAARGGAAAGGARFPKKSSGVLREGRQVRFAALRTIASVLPLARRCALLEVSRSGYYAWCRRGESQRAVTNRVLVGAITQVHHTMDRTYGSPRMQQELVSLGFRCGRHRVARLMQAHGIRAKQARRFRMTTDSRHGFGIAPNRLGRRFRVAAPNTVWMADVTYLPTATGWCYLAVVLDAWSRRVIGWSLDTQITAALTLAALEQAVTTRQPPRRGAASLRSRHPVRVHGLSRRARPARHAGQHESARRLLGQRRGRELLRIAQDRADP